MEKDLFTVKEIMEILNVTQRTVYKYMKKGYIKYSKPAGLIYISNESIRAFIKNKNGKKN